MFTASRSRCFQDRFGRDTVEHYYPTLLVTPHPSLLSNKPSMALRMMSTHNGPQETPGLERT
jgi:hypothetical protein